MNEDPKGTMFLASIVVAALIIIGGCLFLYMSSNRGSEPNRALSTRCEESGGVLVEGVSDTDGSVSTFSVCIPERALYCEDLE